MWAERESGAWATERQKSRSTLQPIFVTACSAICSRSCYSLHSAPSLFCNNRSAPPDFWPVLLRFHSANAPLICCGHCSHEMHRCSLESWFIITYLHVGLCTKSTGIDINKFLYTINKNHERNGWLLLQWITTMETIQWYLIFASSQRLALL